MLSSEILILIFNYLLYITGTVENQMHYYYFSSYFYYNLSMAPAATVYKKEIYIYKIKIKYISAISVLQSVVSCGWYCIYLLRV